MRIAILGTKGIPARYGGFETFAEQLAVRLVSRGHAVTVYSENESSQPRGDLLFAGVTVRFRRKPAWGPASVLAYDCACLWDARRDYDLVYMLGYGAAWACWLPRFFGIPVWINVDGLEWARSKWSKVARLYLRTMEWVSSKAATRVIADSRAIADRFRRYYPSGAPCSYVAYGAEIVADDDADVNALRQWGLIPFQYFIVVARPEPENHVLEIVEGFLKYSGQWPLIVVGDMSADGPYQRRLQALASERVCLIGGIYDAALLQGLRLYAAAYLHGHSVGGTNPSLLEALACGNWVVAHDNPFNREVARDAADYFDTPEQLTFILEERGRLQEEDCLVRRERSRGIVKSFYTWEKITDVYEQLMREQCCQ